MCVCLCVEDRVIKKTAAKQLQKKKTTTTTQPYTNLLNAAVHPTYHPDITMALFVKRVKEQQKKKEGKHTYLMSQGQCSHGHAHLDFQSIL